jgi:hypothetical protein
MSDESDRYLAIYDQHRALFMKAGTQKLSAEEEAELWSVMAELKKLEPYLGSRVEVLDPQEEAAAERVRIYEDHYWKKSELDSKFFGKHHDRP